MKRKAEVGDRRGRGEVAYIEFRDGEFKGVVGIDICQGDGDEG